jgi:hypothetical protein
MNNTLLVTFAIAIFLSGCKLIASVPLNESCTKEISTRCQDGTIYARKSPDSDTPLFMMPCDVGMSEKNGECTGMGNTYSWGTYGVTTGYNDPEAGKSNTADLIAQYGNYNDSAGVVGVPAARACADQTFGGHHDWYLPSRFEFPNLNGELGKWGFGIRCSNNGGCYGQQTYWTSTEYDDDTVFIGGGEFPHLKTNNHRVRCVRR